MFSKIIITQLPEMMNKKCADTAHFVSKIFEDSNVMNRHYRTLDVVKNFDSLYNNIINLTK